MVETSKINADENLKTSGKAKDLELHSICIEPFSQGASALVLIGDAEKMNKFNQDARAASGDNTFISFLKNQSLLETEDDVIQNFPLLTQVMEIWLETNNYSVALPLFRLMLETEDGRKRKDGKTPTGLHPTTQLLWFIAVMEESKRLLEEDPSLKPLIANPKIVAALICIHDLGENHDLTPTNIKEHLKKNNVDDYLTKKQMTQFLRSYVRLSKKFGKEAKNRYESEHKYEKKLFEDLNGFTAKLLDKTHNNMTLIGVNLKHLAHVLTLDGQDNDLKTMIEELNKLGYKVLSPEDNAKHSCLTYIGKTSMFIHDSVEHAKKNFPEQKEFFDIIRRVVKLEVQISTYYTNIAGGKPVPHDNNFLEEAMPERVFDNLPDGLHPLRVPAARIVEMYPESHVYFKNLANSTPS